MPNQTPQDDVISSQEILERLRAKWVFLLGGFLVGLLLAIALLHVIKPKYLVTMAVTPADGSPGGGSSGMGSLGGLAAIAGVSLGKTQSATAFDLYVTFIRSRELADQLAKDEALMKIAFHKEWDAKTEEWHPPRTLGYRLETLFDTIVGRREAWHPPEGADLQKFLEKHLDIVEPDMEDAPITILKILHRDPNFAKHLLAQVNSASDGNVRAQTLDKSTKYARYLANRLRQIDIVELRQDLAEVLNEQEKSIMIASSDVAFSATVVSGPTASPRPAAPNPVMLLILCVFAGTFAGFFAAVLLPYGTKSEERIEEEAD